MKSILMQKAARAKPFKIKRKRSFWNLFYKYRKSSSSQENINSKPIYWPDNIPFLALFLADSN
ncbi:hypothetical protein SAMN04488057_12079 [Cyclobacterium lianum]|uniref:Uncharacterized protein n=1 Tax=Cyclobacterium lianum TaxID=388280 RepID=A0A1M7QMG4_9BACT|nr:hypothetical protein SAMN04488057_12079 [Cyclobacterium lianum]